MESSRESQMKQHTFQSIGRLAPLWWWVGQVQGDIEATPPPGIGAALVLRCLKPQTAHYLTVLPCLYLFVSPFFPFLQVIGRAVPPPSMFKKLMKPGGSGTCL